MATVLAEFSFTSGGRGAVDYIDRCWIREPITLIELLMATPITPEMLADYFVSYLFTKYHGTRHVRRIASWIGFVIKGIERAVGANLQRSRSRQIRFDYHNRQFKVRYSHGTGGRGGIQIVEVLPGRGAPEGNVVADIISLADAERIYRTLGQQLNAFLAAHPTR